MDKRLKNISKVSVALALCAASATATVAIPKTDNVKAAAKKTAKYSYRVQTKKITRTIKMYQPKGMKKVVQKAYIKRKVKTNKKTKKKTYGKWSTSSWAEYKVPSATYKNRKLNYKPDRSSVAKAKVTSKTKNQTVKIKYIRLANGIDETVEVIEKYAKKDKNWTTWPAYYYRLSHPVEDLYATISYSKSTSSDTYGLAIASDGAYTKDSVDAFEKGAAAYKNYKKKWATKHPGIMNNTQLKQFLKKYKFTVNTYYGKNQIIAKTIKH